MSSDQLTPTLMLMTLGIVLILAIGSFAWFLRKRRNRDIAKKVLSGD